MGIEPTRPAWKAGILPLNYTRKWKATTTFLLLQAVGSKSKRNPTPNITTYCFIKPIYHTKIKILCQTFNRKKLTNFNFIFKHAVKNQFIEPFTIKISLSKLINRLIVIIPYCL